MTGPQLGDLIAAGGVLLRCRGCLGPLDTQAEAGLCGRCWAGLVALPEDRCPRCALVHAPEGRCADPTPWTLGDALWDYHGGRPAIGPLLVPAAKARERGWRRALLRRLWSMPLPLWVSEVDALTPVPGTPWRLLLTGADLAGEAASQLAARIGRPCRSLLRKGWSAGQQSRRSSSARRRLGASVVSLRPFAGVSGLRLLLVDDVWTTGATLRRCTQTLLAAGAAEVRVLALFRSEG